MPVAAPPDRQRRRNAALREVSQRLLRWRALEQLGEMADQGDFDEFLGTGEVQGR